MIFLPVRLNIIYHRRCSVVCVYNDDNSKRKGYKDVKYIHNILYIYIYICVIIIIICVQK